MVGKIKHVRQKIHQEAVKLERPSGFSQSPGSVFQSLRLEKPVSALRPSPTENQTIEASKNEKKVSDICLNVLFTCYKNKCIVGLI